MAPDPAVRPDPAVTTRRSDRLSAIVDTVTARETVRVATLAAELGMSRASVRRDLAVLEARGLLRRVHGAATSRPGAEHPVRYRDSRNRDAKARIADACVAEIPRRPMAVALAGGTTTTEVARRLVGRTELTIVTNAVNIAVELAAHPGMKVIVAGGTMRPESYEAVGPMTDRFVEGLNFGITIMGVDGISAAGGLTTHDAVEARTDQGLAQRSQRLIVVADSTKVGRVTLSQIVPATRATLLVTDTAAPADEVDRLRRAGVEVRLV
jgi:DeoR family transcriptional regulator of aga operon